MISPRKKATTIMMLFGMYMGNQKRRSTGINGMYCPNTMRLFRINT
jgi:hypothetical protein